MTKLISLQSQIQALQKQADALRTKEFAATVQEIRSLMSAFGITVKDLNTYKEKKGAKRGAKAKSKLAGRTLPKVVAKYRSPTGETWTGRGLMPKWMKTLLDEGHTKEEFAIAEAFLPDPNAGVHTGPTSVGSSASAAA